MGCCCSKLKVKPMEPNSVVTCCNSLLHKLVQQYDIAQEDRVAFDMLRMGLYELCKASPTSAPVFDLALFISMSKECRSLIDWHMRYRELEGPSKMRAHKKFVELLLTARYRFGDGVGGFTQLATVALLTNVPLVIYFDDPDTYDVAKLRFAATGIYRMEKLYGVEAQERKKEHETHVIALRQGTYYPARGDPLQLAPASGGMTANFDRWLKYCRTVRTAYELPAPGQSDMLTTVVSLLQFFETQDDYEDRIAKLMPQNNEDDVAGEESGGDEIVDV